MKTGHQDEIDARANLAGSHPGNRSHVASRPSRPRPVPYTSKVLTHPRGEALPGGGAEKSSGRDAQAERLAGAGVVESYSGEEGTRVDIVARQDGRYGVTLFDADAGEDLGLTYIYDTMAQAQAKSRSIVGSSDPEEG